MDDLPGRPGHHEHMRLIQFHLKETHNPSTFLFLKGQKIILHGHIGKKVQMVLVQFLCCRTMWIAERERENL